MDPDGRYYYIEIEVEHYQTLVTYDGVVYSRSGSTLQILDGQELERAVLKSTGLSWDAFESAEKTIYDLDHFDSGEDVIIDNWGKAQEVMKGHPNRYHGFETKEECREWFASNPKAVSYVKKPKSPTKQYHFSLPRDIADKLDEKVASIGTLSVQDILVNLVKDYLGFYDDDEQ